MPPSKAFFATMRLTAENGLCYSQQAHLGCATVRRRQAPCKGAEVSGIAPTTSAQEMNALVFGYFCKAFKSAARKLNGLHFIGKLRQSCKAGYRVRGAERRRLRSNWDAHCFPHFPCDRQYPIRFLLTVDTD